MRVVSRLIRTASIAALCASAGAFAACSTPAVAEESTQTEGAVRSQASAHTGKFFDKVFDELNLRPEQKTEIDKLRTAMKERHAPVKAAKGELMGVLADQIVKGDIDRCALRPAIEKFSAAVAKANPDDRASMERLHEILDPEQRVAFVDKLRAHVEEMKKAHDKSVMGEAIAKGLDLTSDQKERLGKIFAGLKEIKEADPHVGEHKERMTKLLDAFKGDKFDIDELDPPKDVEAKVGRKMKHLLWAGEAVLPVLTDEQRVQVAKFLREKSERHEQQSGSDGARNEVRGSDDEEDDD